MNNIIVAPTAITINRDEFVKEISTPATSMSENFVITNW
jgi:hypothetical protein